MKKNKVISILLFVILGAFLFYWFQLRPAEIKHECAQIIKGNKNLYISNINAVYEPCLHDKGL